jgi:hypothetical protein
MSGQSTPFGPQEPPPQTEGLMEFLHNQFTQQSERNAAQEELNRSTKQAFEQILGELAALRERERPKSLDEEFMERIATRAAAKSQSRPASPLKVPETAPQTTLGQSTPGLYTPASKEPAGYWGEQQSQPTWQQKELMGRPQRFDGDKAKYRIWKMEMQLKIEYDGPLLARRGMYLPSYVISFLDGDAGNFALHRLPEVLARSYPLERLWKEFDLRFGDPFLRRRAQNEYALLKQGKTTFNEFFLEFERLSIEAGKADNPDNVKIDDLRDKISSELTQLMIHKDETLDYAEFVQQLHDVDTRFQAAKSRNAFRYPLTSQLRKAQSDPDEAKERRPRSPRINAGQPPPPRSPEAMDWTRTNVTNPGRQRSPPKGKMQLPEYARRINDAEIRARRRKGACFNCGNQGHINRNCHFERVKHELRVNAAMKDEAVQPPTLCANEGQETDSEAEN